MNLLSTPIGVLSAVATEPEKPTRSPDFVFGCLTTPHCVSRNAFQDVVQNIEEDGGANHCMNVQITGQGTTSACHSEQILIYEWIKLEL
jgi:hypothetical protein